MSSYISKITAADALVVGAGFAGATIARELAERGNLRVALIDRRDHIGGNAYDHLDEQGVLIHAYGPHIFHTDSARVYDYLSRFTSWNGYSHLVLASIQDKLINVPFNLNSINASFAEEKAEALTKALLQAYPLGSKVGILELRQQPEQLLQELADYVYNKVFLHYTMKQWGLTPEQIDPAVTARVPVLVDYDNRYFQDSWQGLPLMGYAALFEKLLDHPNISLFLGVAAQDVLKLATEEAAQTTQPDSTSQLNKDDTASQPTQASLPTQASQPAQATQTTQPDLAAQKIQSIQIAGQPYTGLVIYTGALDELLDWQFGILPYRSLEFKYRHYPKPRVQAAGTINYTVSENYTRTTEYSWLTGQKIEVSTVAEEYPQVFTDPQTQIPYYPIITEDNQAAYQRYLDLLQALPNFYVLGRLAEYRYYNIDQIVLRALELADQILAGL
jgi:UDP-galactopyranose mutase